MITRNGNSVLVNGGGDGIVIIKDYNGVFISVSPYMYISGLTKTHDSSGSPYTMLEVGNGITKESIDDYKLESVVNTLTIESFTVSYPRFTSIDDLNETNWKQSKLKYIFVLSNKKSDPITISEVGLYIYRYYSSKTYRFLIYRKAFEPITIAPGETYSFVIELG